MSADTTDETTTDVDETPAWVAPEGHTHLVSDEVRDAAATPIAWDESLPADGIVEHNAPGEFVASMVYGDGAGDPLEQDPGAVLTAGAHEVPEPPKGAAPERPAPAKKAPAKKAAAKKAPAKAAGAKATK